MDKNKEHKNHNLRDENEIYEELVSFMNKNFPQIQMHGGASQIINISPETESVTIELSGACSGCGISPMTSQALQRRIAEDIDGISIVQIEIADGNMTPY